LDKIVEKRMTKRPMGLMAKATDDEASVVQKLGGIEAEDLSKFGLIPEFIGRVPVNAMLEELDEEALVSILTEPKNAITKQYQKLFDMDGIELEFEPDALVEVARIALKKKTGARGLRAILEQTMLDVMYDIPTNEKIGKVVITRASILGTESPTLVEGQRKTAGAQSTVVGKKSIESA